ncbi:transporter substrate-binding domain-containing protein [Pigmentibacter sp. JX0631]|uniref:substrate-binding periplasmic protein n=1 Tax=Pigmentibacter sp. JX0631 TaxID=2976982 RepID=UPI0024689843|nr:transporter substrate-binding domain-containing protein [Pigmentibacter sp. JX0631]WGL58592.1 transporter substrate-binding domain-containing protein [Pigmentibacter sp. JX0631]
MGSKFILTFIGLLLIQISSFSSETKQVIKIGFFILPGITFEDENKQPKGALIEFYTDYVFKNLPYEVKFLGYPYSRMLKEIESGEIDMIAVTSSDKIKMNFITGKSVLHKNKNFIITRNDFPYKEITAASQLRNYVIWIRQDSALCPFMAKNLHKFKVEYSPGKNSVEYVTKRLISKRIDAIYALNILPLLYVIKKENIFDQIKVVKIPGQEQSVFAGYSKKLDKKIRDRIEKEILINNKDNKIEKIFKKYLSNN